MLHLHGGLRLEHRASVGRDLPRVAFDESRQILSGTAKRQKGEEGTIFIHVPRGYAVGGRDAKKVRVKGEIAALPLDFKRAEVPWSVRFTRRRS